MRTWDRIRAGEWHSAATQIEFARDPIVVIGDEVAQMVLDGVQPEFPVCAPPWDDFIIEMQPSPWPLVLARGPEHPPDPRVDDEANGILLSFTNMTNIKLPLSHAVHTPEFAKRAMAIVDEVKERGGWVVGLEIFADFPGGVMPIYWTGIIVEADGTAISMESAYSFMTTRSIDAAIDDPEWIAIDAMVCSGLMSISLINCSNVGLADETPEYTRHERRRLIRKDKPVVSFKRLHIKPHKSSRSGGATTEEGDGVGIHIVRGHFKTYTAEKPLLGRFTGTWWWNAQVRGTAQRFVIKDYEVDKT